MAGNNGNGWADVRVNYGGISPAEALNFGSQLRERHKEREDALAAQKANRQQQMAWKDYQLVQDIGKDFKPLPQRLQDFSNQKLQELKDEFSDPQYLSLDPALLGTIIQQKVQPFVQWHQQAESAATAFDDNFKRWSSVNSNVPANQAYEWGANQFANDFLTYGKDGDLTYQSPSLIKQRDYVNGNPDDPNEPSLSHPDVVGQFDVDISPLSKTISGLEKVPVGDKQYVSKRGVVHATNWSGVGTNFSNPVEDANGNITGLELGYNTIPGTNIKTVTPDFKQAIINSPANANAYARMRYLTKQHLSSNGAPADDNTVGYMTDNALHGFASSLIPHDIKTSETTKTPVTRITVNAGNQAPPVYDLYSDVIKSVRPVGESGNAGSGVAGLNEIPQKATEIILPYAQKAWGMVEPDENSTNTDPKKLTIKDIKVGYDGNQLRIINYKTGESINVDKNFLNLAANGSVKQDMQVIQQGNAQQQQPKPVQTGTKKKASASAYGL